MKKSLLFLTLFVLAISLFGTLQVFAATLSIEKIATVESGETAEGVVFENFTGLTYTDYGTEGMQNISYVKKSFDSPVKVVAYSKIEGSSIVGADLLELAEDYEINHPGYQVVAGINGDYYNMTTKTPINALVQSTDLIKYNNFALPRYFSVGFTDDATNYIRSKNNEVEASYVLSIYDETDTYIIKEIKLSSFNTAPGADGTTIYYKPLQATSVPETTMFLLQNSDYLNYGTLFLKGRVTDEVTQTTTLSDYATIVTKADQIMELLRTNPQVRIQKNLIGDNLGYENIIGVGSQPLVDNEILSFADIEDQNLDFASSRAPRSTFGFTESGDLIIAAIDGRQTGMDGVNLREEAIIMQSLGCVNAFNLDGGGSTQLVIRDEEGLRFLNSPSETYRNVANGILFVVPDVYIDATFANFTTTSVSVNYNLRLNSGSTLIDMQILVNNEEISVNDTEFTVDQLIENGINYISFVATYEKDDLVLTRCFLSKRINLEELIVPEPVEKVKPYDFSVGFVESDAINGFEARISFEDPSNTFFKMYLINSGVKKIATKAIQGYKCEFLNIEPDTVFEFQIEYYYRLNTFIPIYETYEESFTYHYKAPVPDDPIDDEEDVPDDPIDEEEDMADFSATVVAIILGSFASIIGISLIISKKRLPII